MHGWQPLRIRRRERLEHRLGHIVLTHPALVLGQSEPGRAVERISRDIAAQCVNRFTRLPRASAQQAPVEKVMGGERGEGRKRQEPGDELRSAKLHAIDIDQFAASLYEPGIELERGVEPDLGPANPVAPQLDLAGQKSPRGAM